VGRAGVLVLIIDLRRNQVVGGKRPRIGVTPGPAPGRLTAGTAGAPARCRIVATGHLTSAGGRRRGISRAAVAARSLRRTALAARTLRWRRVHGSAGTAEPPAGCRDTAPCTATATGSRPGTTASAPTTAEETAPTATATERGTSAPAPTAAAPTATATGRSE
jgi:hypothetical protein